MVSRKPLAFAAFLAAIILWGCDRIKSPVLLVENPDTARIEVKANSTFQITATLRNTSGSEFVQILQLDSSCGCTTATINSRIIRPRGSIPLVVSVNTAGLDGPSETGLGVKWKTESNPQVNLSFLKIEFDAIAMLEGPKYKDLGKLPFDGGSVSSKIEFHRGKGIAWDKLVVLHASSGLFCRPLESKSTEVSIVLDPKSSHLPIGVYHGDIIFGFSHDGKLLEDHYTLRVVAQITSDINVSPSSLYLGVVPHNITVSKTISLSSPLKRIKYVSATCDQPGFVDIFVKSVKSSERNLDFTVKFNPQHFIGNQSGKLTLNLEDGSESCQLSIPYLVFIANP